MDGKYAKVSDSSRSFVVDLKRKRATGFATCMAPNAIPQVSTWTSSKLGKRKKPDVCKAKCRTCKLASRRSLLRYYENFMKSGLPKRLMFYQKGEWIDHELEVVGLVKKDFEYKRAAAEVKLKSYHLVLDFVRMMQFNLKTSLEQSIAWIDESGGCFFPEVYVDVDDQYVLVHPEIQKDGLYDSQEIKLQIEIEVNGVGDSKSMEYCGESSPVVKRVKVGQNAEVEDCCDKVSGVKMIEYVGENHNLDKYLDAEIEKKNFDLDSDAVKELFLKGMNSTVSPNVVGICPNSGAMYQGRLELFMKQVEITKKYRCDPNVRYAWLASSKEASSGIMTYGLGHFGFQQMKSIYGGVGVNLTAANCADTSASYCDVDENGVQHMVLCRVILGNMEVVHRGSKQFHPSSENFDSGVDDPENPRHYIVWSMNISTHIYPEYVVSFKVPANREGEVLKNDGNLAVQVKAGHQSFMNQIKIEAAVDIGNDHLSNITSDGSKERNAIFTSLPKSPWMPFPMLFQAISQQVPQNKMKLLLAYYEIFRNKKICREDFVKELRIIVGDTLLRSMIQELSYKASDNVVAATNQQVGS